MIINDVADVGASSSSDDMMKIGRCLAKKDFVFIEAAEFFDLIDDDGVDDRAVEHFAGSWDDLKPDTYMADGGTYRLRRHAILTAQASGGAVRLEPHGPHHQTVSYNRLNGGIERHFAPIAASTIDNPVMKSILNFASVTFGAMAPFNTWHVEAHQFRIVAETGGGRPTPEGMHRDGVDYVLMTLISRVGVSGGETSIQDLDERLLDRFTLAAPFDTALVDDHRVAHGVTPVLPIATERAGHRDILVVTFRRK